MATDTGIDPRYAAQFQRGFDPARHVAEPMPEPRGPVRISAGPLTVAQRVPPPPPVAERPLIPGPAVDRAVVAHRAAEAPPADEPEFSATRPRLEWAVLLVGLGMLALAVLLFLQAVDLSTDYTGIGSAFDDQLRSLAANALPGPLLVAGVVAVCLWIALRAVRLPRSEP